MAVTEETLRQVGIRTTPDEFERLVVTALGEMRPVPTEAEPSQELPSGELAALIRGGFSLAPLSEREGDDPIARAVALWAALMAGSLSVSEVAHSLGVNPSRIRQRLASHTLYGLKGDGSWRLPAFQFDHGHPLPGLEQVLVRLDPNLHPVAVYSWFTAPDPDLCVGHRPVSPRDWLRLGNHPAAVASIAAAL